MIVESSLSTRQVPFLGDLSRADALVLTHFAHTAKAILEFGAGGSTQIFAQVAPLDTPIVCIETDLAWIERTRKNLARLGIVPDRVTFLSFPANGSDLSHMFDLVFDDGVDELRLHFAKLAWSQIVIGGNLLFHDTRRQTDMINVFSLVNNHFLEVAEIVVNLHGSNITRVVKKIAEPYEDWNVAENRELWRQGLAEPPAGWPEQ